MAAEKNDKSAQESPLKINGKHFARAEKIARLGSWQLDLNTNLVHATDGAAGIYGVEEREFPYEKICTIPLPEYREPLDQAMKALLAGTAEYDVEFRIRRASDGRIRTIHSIADYQPREKLITGVIQDISEARKIETALKESEKRYRSLFDHSVSGLLYSDLDGKILEVNDAMLRMLGSPSEEETKKINVLTFPLLMKVGFSADFRKAMESGNTVHNASYYESKWGRSHYMEYDLTPIRSEGKIPGIMAKIEDVTERREAEQRIERLLREKELLLREVHHRIRNNIASIEGLLKIQLAESSDPRLNTALGDAVNYLSGMHLLYEKLFSSADYREVDSKEYLSELVDDITAVFPNSRDVTIRKELKTFLIPAEMIFPLGIIVNEVLTNAFKYAFVEPDDNKQIFISAKETDGTATLVISDNGIGFDGAADADGFGLQLIKMLSQQIGGDIAFENAAGTRFTLRFNTHA